MCYYIIMKPILPYNDNLLEFNEKTQKYELTIETIKNNFDVYFNDDGVLTKRIRKNSRLIYNYIFSHSYSGNKRVILHFLHFTDKGREFLYDALLSQMEADLESGYNTLIDQPAIDFKNGSVINRNEIVRNQVSVATEQILLSSMGYFGFNLLYSAPFPYRIVLLYQNNLCSFKGKVAFTRDT